MSLKVSSVHIPKLKIPETYTQSKTIRTKNFLRMVKKGGMKTFRYF